MAKSSQCCNIQLSVFALYFFSLLAGLGSKFIDNGCQLSLNESP